MAEGVAAAGAAWEPKQHDLVALIFSLQRGHKYLARLPARRCSPATLAVAPPLDTAGIPAHARVGNTPARTHVLTAGCGPAGGGIRDGSACAAPSARCRDNIFAILVRLVSWQRTFIHRDKSIWIRTRACRMADAYSSSWRASARTA